MWSQSWPKIVKKFLQGCPKVLLQLFKVQGCLQHVPKWSPSCLKYVSMGSRSCLKIVFFVQFFIWLRTLLDQFLFFQLYFTWWLLQYMKLRVVNNYNAKQVLLFLLRIVSKLSQGCPQAVPKLSKSFVPSLSPSCLQVVFKLSQICPKIA